MPQTVFNVESSGGVLIVAPVGDALGFREADVVRNIESVLIQIRDLTPPLVVVDLANSGYFGSVIIGALVSFADAVEGTGGAFVACNVSEQMAGVFKVMRLDQRWNICDTRRQAIRAVRKAAS